jgi:riboflavin synthase alpha subunit
LKQRAVGDRVNLETDVIAKYVEKMLAHISLPK